MSRHRALWRLTVATSTEAEDAVAAWLSATFGRTASSFANLETGETTVTVYLEAKPDWSRAGRDRVAAGVESLRRFGLETGPGKVRLARIRQADWAQAWKAHFKPIEVGGALLVQPSWSRRRAKAGQALVVLDPGLSFGTGQHPTTSFCLGQIVRRRRAGRAQSFLDVGTGSGILAIAAAKLGYSPVHALDFDPEAIGIARANARRNGVGRRIKFWRQDVTRLPYGSNEQYGLVCVNLISTLLLEQRDRLLARVKEGGFLVLAGILRTEFARVQGDYESAGWRMVSGRSEKEWRSGVFGREGVLPASDF